MDANVVMNVAPLVRAGTATALVDGLFACALTFVYGSTVQRLWQNVASTLLGPAAFDGGWATASIGILMHIGVAFTWSAVFVLLTMRSAWLRKVLASRKGVFKVAAVYGPFIWIVMSLIVIPLLVRRPPAITYRWWIQLAGHFPFVGIPIVASVARSGRDR